MMIFYTQKSFPNFVPIILFYLGDAKLLRKKFLSSLFLQEDEMEKNRWGWGDVLLVKATVANWNRSDQQGVSVFTKVILSATKSPR